MLLADAASDGEAGDLGPTGLRTGDVPVVLGGGMT